MADARDAERALVLAYAPERSRAAMAAILALDDALARIVRTTREPIVGQMRLTWWYEALRALDAARPPAEPVLLALHADVLPHGVAGAALADMVDGWEILLAGDTIDAAAIDRFAHARGAGLFIAMARVLGAGDAQVAQAGEGWALADLAAHLRDPSASVLAKEAARARLSPARWSRPGRPLGAMALLAAFDVADPSPPPAGPRRVARLGWLRLTGR